MLEITFPLMLISTCMLAQGRVKVERFNCSNLQKGNYGMNRKLSFCAKKIQMQFFSVLLLTNNSTVFFSSINVHKRKFPAKTQTKPQSP